MRIFHLQSTVLLAVIVLISGCSTGRRAFERGDYDKAVYQAVNRLRNDSDNRKASATLRRAYNYAVNTHLKQVEKEAKSSNPYRWERVVDHYRSINALHDEILYCPACLALIPEPRSYAEELSNARQQAAEQRYQMAQKALKNKEMRSNALMAHRHLLVAQQMMPGYKNTANLLEEALYFATIHIVVEPIPAPTTIMQLNQEFFSNKLMEYLNRNTINPYVEFFTPAEVEARKIERVDHRISMQFDQFSLGNVISHTETEEVSRDSVLLNPGDDPEVYGTVRARFKKHEKGIVGRGILDFKITDPGLNKVVSQEKFPSEFRWTTTWATFMGDERALYDDQKELLNRKEIPLPNPQFMFEQFAAPLYDQVVKKLHAYYSDY